MTFQRLNFALWVRRLTMLASIALVAACGGSNEGGNTTPTAVSGNAAASNQAASASHFSRLFSVASEPTPSAKAKAKAPTDAKPAQLYSVQTHASALARIQVGDSFELAMPNMAAQTVRVTFKDVQLGSIFSIGGVVVGEPNSRVQLSGSGSAMSGSVLLGGNLWQLRTTAQGTTLQNETADGVIQMPSHTPEVYEKARKAQEQSNEAGQPENSPVAPASPGAPKLPTKPIGAASSQSMMIEPAAGSAKVRQVAVAQAISAPEPAVIDLLIVGDKSFQNAMGSEANELAQLASLIAAANQSMADSNAFAQYRLKGYQRLGSDLALISQETIFANFSSLTGVFSGLWPQLLSSGADVAVVASQFSDAKQNVCGLANVGRFSGTSSQFNHSQPFKAIVALSLGIRASDNGRCRDTTLAHELGHVLGSTHDRANTSNFGAFSYSYGWGVSGIFGDIMSYINPRFPYFSSPSLFKCAGRACGTATDDAVRTFNNTAPLVAAANDPDNRLSGWYYDPQESGTGWAIEVANGRSFIAGFVYRDDGLPTWVVGYGAPCAAKPSAWCAGLDEYEGGQTLTGPYKPARLKRRVADAELTFGAGYPAALSLNINGVVRNLQRFQFVTNGLATKPTLPGSPLGGWYYNPNASGTGIFHERQGDQIFAAYFYYRDDGSATWSVANGKNWRPSNPLDPNTGYTSNSLPFTGYANGQTLFGAFKPANVINANEASTFVAFGSNTSFTSFNSKGTRSNEVWSRFSF